MKKEYLETIDDLNRKYHKTFVIYDGELSYVNGFDGGKDEIYIMLKHQNPPGSPTTAKNGIWDPSKLEEIHWDAHFLNIWQNSKPKLQQVVAIWRVPARQWRRSVSDNNISIQRPLFPLLVKVHGLTPNPHLSWELLRSMLNPTYIPINEVEKHLPVCGEAALSKVHPTSSDLLLMNLYGFIGTFTGKGFLIHHEPAYQEFVDFLHRTKQSYPVKVTDAPF